MTAPVPTGGGASSSRVGNSKLAAATAALALAAGGGLFATLRTQTVANVFMTCAEADSIQHQRVLKMQNAIAAKDDVYEVPIVRDSAGFPKLDTAHKFLIDTHDTTQKFALFCRVPTADPTVVPPAAEPPPVVAR